MVKNVALYRRLIFMVALLALAALACNFQTDTPTDEAPPTATDTRIPEVPGEGTNNNPTVGPTNTVPPPETLPANVPTEASQATLTPRPTFTPISVPTLAITLTPTGTSTRQATVTRGSSQPPGNTSGPLSFEYTISWRLADASAKEAIATVTITAKGGGGGYRYYRDIDEVQSTFEYIWATCRGNPTTFRVTSASGESVEQILFFNPPCPTATPNS